MAGVESRADPRGKPWRCSTTALAPNALLMCKLLFLLLVIEGFSSKIADPYLPFVPALDAFGAWPGLFEGVLRAVFFAAGALLLMNLAPRSACLSLGVVVVLALLASKSVFRNHLFICGALLLMVGLQRKGEEPWLARLQLGLVYLSAFLNKLLEADWRSGQFMHNWLQTALGNPYYGYVSAFLPDLVLATALSWTAMLMELVVGICLLTRPLRATGVWLGLVFHFALFVLLLGGRFGHFFDDILIAYLAFLSWPRVQLLVCARDSARKNLERLLRIFDWDRGAYISEPCREAGVWLELRLEERRIQNEAALRYILRHSAGFYVILFAFYFAALKGLPWSMGVPLISLVGSVLLIGFLPIPWTSLLQRVVGQPPSAPHQ